MSPGFCKLRVEGRGRRLERLLDIVGAASLFVITSPIWATVAALVRLTSPGPVLFSQERLGRNGTRFRIHKFRSMRVDAEAILANDPILQAKHLAGGHKISDAEDWRITPIGRVLRRLRLDELPQLYNVLRGDMSLVGPRPIVPAEAQRYSSYVDLMRAARPGITGLWQISGATAADYAYREAVDRDYVRTRSLRTDIVILVRTLGLVLWAALPHFARQTDRPQDSRVPNLAEGEQHLHGS